MAKRILLLRVNSAIESAPVPLGLMYIASYLKSKTKDTIEMEILDARSKDLSLEATKRAVLDYSPDILGITSMHAEKAEVHKIARMIKEAMPKIKIVIGGPYPSSEYMHLLEDKNIDYAVIGEGEEVFHELIADYLRGQQDLSAIRGLAYRKEGHVCFSGLRAFIQDIDSLPLPAWGLLNLDDYFYGKKRSLENPMQNHKRAVPILSSRGCPHQCTYCHNIFGKKFRGRSPQNVLKEIALLTSVYGIKEIEFLDDSFNIDKARAVEIFHKIVEQKLNIRICFSNGIRLDRVDDSMLVLMKKAGVYRINYGIESASKRIQNIIKKNLDIDKAQDVINRTVKNRILCGGFFMIGFPTEREEEVLETLKFAFSSKLHTAVFAIVTPFPSTQMYNQAFPRVGISNSVDFCDVQKVTLNLSNVPKSRLENLRFYAYRRFYFNLFRIIRIFFDAPSIIPLFRNFIEVVRVGVFKKPLYSN